MSITDAQIDAITDPAELSARIALATGDMRTDTGFAWDTGPTPAEMLPWYRNYFQKLIWPWSTPPGDLRICRDFVGSSGNAEWAASQRSLTRGSGESNTDLGKRLLKSYNAGQQAG